MSISNAKVIDQKEYLKKYLSGDKEKKKKKHKQKKHKKAAKVKIIDDDAYNSDKDEVDEELLLGGEDAPQIVGEYIEENPNEIRSKWRNIAVKEEEETAQEEPTVRIKAEPRDADDEENRWGRKASSLREKSPVTAIKIKQERCSPSSDQSAPRRRRQSPLPRKIKEEDLSPPRRKQRDSDQSPPRRRKQSPPRRRRSNSDQSPPRRRNESDLSPVRRRRLSAESSPARNRHKRRSPDQSPVTAIKIKQERRSPSSDQSPPRRKRRDSDQSPPRRRKQSPPRRRRSNSDQSPPRRRNDSDLSPVRRRRPSAESSPARNRQKRRSPDQSPHRRRRDSDQSPARRKKGRHADQSPPREPKDKGRSRSPRRRRSSDQSPPRKDRFKKETKHSPSPSQPVRKSRWAKASPSLSPPPTHKPKTSRTLDGKKAGLQDAQSLKAESDERRRREHQLFEKMSSEVSGRDADIQIRSTGRRGRRAREAANEDPAVQKRKEEHERKKKELYDRWGRGLKQLEDHKSRQEEMAHEASKPVARYANDEDLDRHLREQEHADDPMLEYMRAKRKKLDKQAGKPEMPKYEGSFPENRFGIRPGYRWDGVDRSNGYENRWFNKQNERVAIQDEAYKYSVEDM
ncbi:BUD13 homolog isoform X1 [Drosophila tropicalis]|uniref:BUD13 homolog isoform X1 n=1 Tax=Drosophila tropicalis TaxID=46794 RepID=UPI0035AB7AC5